MWTIPSAGRSRCAHSATLGAKTSTPGAVKPGRGQGQRQPLALGAGSDSANALDCCNCPQVGSFGGAMTTLFARQLPCPGVVLIWLILLTIGGYTKAASMNVRDYFLRIPEKYLVSTAFAFNPDAPLAPNTILAFRKHILDQRHVPGVLGRLVLDVPNGYLSYVIEESAFSEFVVWYAPGNSVIIGISDYDIYSGNQTLRFVRYRHFESDWEDMTSKVVLPRARLESLLIAKMVQRGKPRDYQFVYLLPRVGTTVRVVAFIPTSIFPGTLRPAEQINLLRLEWREGRFLPAEVR